MFKPLLAALLLLTTFGCGPDYPPVRVDDPEVVDAGFDDAGESEPVDEDDGPDAGRPCKCHGRWADGGKPHKQHGHCRGGHGPH